MLLCLSPSRPSCSWTERYSQGLPAEKKCSLHPVSLQSPKGNGCLAFRPGGMGLILQFGIRLWCEQSTPEPLSTRTLATTCSAGGCQPDRLISMGRNVVQEFLENQNFPYIDTAEYGCLPSTQSHVQVTVTNKTAAGRQSASHMGGTDKHIAPKPRSHRTFTYFGHQATTHVWKTASVSAGLLILISM